MNVPTTKKITPMLCAELVKIMTLPLTWITFIGIFLVNVLLTAAFTSTSLQVATGTQSVLNIGLASMGYLQAGFIIVGILATCSEYTGGQIRTTLITMPWRGFQLSAKYLAIGLLTIPIAFIIVASGVLYSFFMMRDTITLAAFDTVLKSLAGATGYLTLTTLLSSAVGSLFRRTTPALVILVSYYFIVSPLMREFLSSMKNVFPDTAGYYMYMLSPDELNGLTFMQGTGISLAWTLIFMIGSVIVYRERDA